MRKILFLTVFFMSSALFSFADNTDSYPTINVTMDYTTADGTEQKEATSVEGSAPIQVTFNFTVTGDDGWTHSSPEWRFAHEGGSLDDPYMRRYEDSPSVTFTQAGTDSIALYIVFAKGDKTYPFQSEYWRSEGTPLLVHATESKLTFPNAFSPNGDGINDYYKPKEYTSIVEFKAVIFNRWAQKIYSWNDVAGDGWDGTFKGKNVKQGTYFMQCTAKGADGTVFNIKKDVNLLRSYNEEEDDTSTGSSSTSE